MFILYSEACTSNLDNQSVKRTLKEQWGSSNLNFHLVSFRNKISRNTVTELYSSSGEVSDKSRSSSEVESDSEKPSKISSKRHTDECSGEVEEILRVELPEGESSKSTSKHNRSSFSNRLADFRRRYESDEEVENPFEMETIVESTSIGLSQMRNSPGGLSPRNRHQPPRRDLPCQSTSNTS